jgi:hypothetical protein
LNLDFASRRCEVAKLSRYLGRRWAARFDPTKALPNRYSPGVGAWLDEASSALVPALNVVDCLLNPPAIPIGGRLPDDVLDLLAAETRSNPPQGSRRGAQRSSKRTDPRRHAVP